MRDSVPVFGLHGGTTARSVLPSQRVYSNTEQDTVLLCCCCALLTSCSLVATTSTQAAMSVAANALEDNQEQKGDLSYHYWANKTGEPPLPKPEPKVRRRWSVREGARARDAGVCEAPDGLCGGRTGRRS